MKHEARFKIGGIMPHYDHVPLNSEIHNAFLPVNAIVALKQHPGPASRCIVNVGDTVREWQVIGRAGDTGSSTIHAPIPGVVTEIRNLSMPGGDFVDGVVIALSGSFEHLGRKPERFPWKVLSAGEILQVLLEKGLASHSGQGYSLFEQLKDAEKEGGARIIIVNSMETEPYLASERMIILERLQDVMEGLDILAKVLKPSRVFIAAGSSVLDSLEPQLEKLSHEDRQGSYSVEMIPCSSRFPQELPNQIEISCLKKTESGKSRFIVTPSTLLSVFEALVFNKPVVDRYITISGDAIKHPAILKARIGTPIGDLIEECGGFKGVPSRVIMNGPMRGYSIFDLDTPVLKTTSAILALTAHSTKPARRAGCIRCGRCIDSCPEALYPVLMFKTLDQEIDSDTVRDELSRCTECGACAYACPARIPLVELFSLERRETAKRSTTGANP